MAKDGGYRTMLQIADLEEFKSSSAPFPKTLTEEAPIFSELLIATLADKAPMTDRPGRPFGHQAERSGRSCWPRSVDWSCYAGVNASDRVKTSDRNVSVNSATSLGPRFSPDRNRTATCSAATSRSPTTSMNGILSS
jgi:hypothetical protein